jgi:ribosome biogenesis protein MAK21
MLLFQVMESRSSVSGRYYQALYAKLMDPALKYSGKQVRCWNMDAKLSTYEQLCA